MLLLSLFQLSITEFSEHFQIYPQYIWCRMFSQSVCNHLLTLGVFIVHVGLPTLSFLFGLAKYTYYIPRSEILEFSSVINFDIITSDDINFHFHFLPYFRNYFKMIMLIRYIINRIINWLFFI